MRRAFTLVELIVVVIIIGILLAVGVPQYRKALERARGAEAYAGLGNIQEAEKVYYASNEVYFPCGDGATECTDGEENTLDISLPQNAWYFTIEADTAAIPPVFTATATRRLGPCAGAGDNTIVVNEKGPVSDVWKTCVDGL